MARKPKTAPQLPLAEERTQEQKEFAEGYKALLRILYARPWDGMTPESVIADADAWERDFRNLPEEIARGKEGAVEDAIRYLDFARTYARRGDVPRAWEEMQIVARLSRWARKGGLFA